MFSIVKVNFIYRNAQIGKISNPANGTQPAGGHIAIGENVEIALKREVQEELGITDYIPKRIGQYVFESNCEKELIYVHKTTYNKVLHPNQEELNGGRFWTSEEIKSNLGKNIFTPNFESEYIRFFRNRE